MGQNASSESANRSAHPDVASPGQGGATNGDALVSEDETMADVSSSPMRSAGRGSSLLQQAAVNVSRIHPERTRGTARASRRSLWCRLRNRINRTTGSVHLGHSHHPTSSTAAVPGTNSSSTQSRRNTLGESLLGGTSNRRRSTVFGAPRPRPQSLHGADPFSRNINPRLEPLSDRRPTSSQGVFEPRERPSSNRRSIWGASTPPSSSPTPANETHNPAVIDHSTQTTTLNHPQPFNITRRPGEDQAEMLSRFLYVAGAALAASLVGSTEAAATQLQDFSADFADATEEELANAQEGSFEGFLRALRQGRTQFAHALRNDSEHSSGEESSAAFTYLLMYRFHSVTPTTTTTTTTPATGIDSRSQTPSDEINGTAMTIETRPQTPLPPSSTLPPPTSESTTASEPRMIPFVIIGVQPVPPRDQSQASVPSFSEGVASLLANARQNASQSRPGTRPSSRSGNATTSDASSLRGTTAIPPIPGSWRDSPPPSHDHLRRRASIDGSFRHNSSVGTTTSPNRDREPTTRAWQMYIYGGAYPENHLIFTAPTLFTDSPSTEDMLLLASILGEVKPPVASKEDIDAAGGITKVGDEIKLSEEERCLVCLSEYEKGEECRTLSGCGHIFHRECIDQWLGSGRNACPLCRGVGVPTKEAKNPSPPSSESSTTTPISSPVDVSVAVE